jgi:hypothetical protein
MGLARACGVEQVLSFGAAILNDVELTRFLRDRSS